MGFSGLFRVLAEKTGNLSAIKKGSAYLQMVAGLLCLFEKNLIN